VTGFTLLHRQLSEKRVDLIRTLLPQAKTITVLLNPVPGAELAFATMQETARTLGMTIDRIEAASPEAFRALRPDQLLANGGAPVVVAPDAMLWNNDRRWSHSSTPRICLRSIRNENMPLGGLISYGASVPENFRAAAGYVHGAALKAVERRALAGLNAVAVDRVECPQRALDLGRPFSLEEAPTLLVGQALEGER
jgi:putative tryptophan/tyrosine transport system substrate-binding protein